MAPPGRPPKPKHSPEETAKRVQRSSWTTKRERDKLFRDLCWYWKVDQAAILSALQLPTDYNIRIPDQPPQPSHAPIPLEALEFLVKRIPNWQADEALREQIGYQQDCLRTHCGRSESPTRSTATRVREFLLRLGPNWVPAEVAGSGKWGIQEELVQVDDALDYVIKEFNDAFGEFRKSGEADKYYDLDPKLEPWERQDILKAFYRWTVDQWVAADTREGPGRSDLAYTLYGAVVRGAELEITKEGLQAIEDYAVKCLDQLIYRRRGDWNLQREGLRSHGLLAEEEDWRLTPHEKGRRALANAVGTSTEAVMQAIKRGNRRPPNDQKDRNKEIP